MERRRRRAVGAQYPHGVHQTGACRQIAENYPYKEIVRKTTKS